MLTLVLSCQELSQVKNNNNNNNCHFEPLSKMEQPTTVVTHENEGADEADGLPLQFSNPAHGDLRDTSFGR